MLYSMKNLLLPISCLALISFTCRLNAQPDLLNVMENGNVGIGISTPLFPLDISANQGVLRMESTTNIFGSVIELKNTTASPTFLGAINFNDVANSYPGQIAYLDGDTMTFTVKSEVMRISASRKVGVETKNPLSTLSVGGDGVLDAAIYGETSLCKGIGMLGYASAAGDIDNTGGSFTANGKRGYGVTGTSSNYEGKNYGGYFVANGDEGIGAYGGSNNFGNVTTYGGYFETFSQEGRGVYGAASGTNGKGVVGYGGVASTSYDFDAIGPGVNYGSTSSIRWKKNIKLINNPLEKLKKLRGVYFDWDMQHGGGHDVGMIAEEVGEVLPEIVVYEPNGIDADGMDYSKLTPLLVEAVKAQQGLIERLFKRIEILENHLLPNK